MEHFQRTYLTLVAFVIYLISGNAEANRGPFDLAEAEQELTAGYIRNIPVCISAFSTWPSI